MQLKSKGIFLFTLLPLAPGVFNTNVFTGNRYWETTSQQRVQNRAVCNSGPRSWEIVYWFEWICLVSLLLVLTKYGPHSHSTQGIKRQKRLRGTWQTLLKWTWPWWGRWQREAWSLVPEEMACKRGRCRRKMLWTQLGWASTVLEGWLITRRTTSMTIGKATYCLTLDLPSTMRRRFGIAGNRASDQVLAEVEEIMNSWKYPVTHPHPHPEGQKPKTFRVATFYTQKLSRRSARNRFSWQA